ncbi:NAD-P-binding protein [Trametes cingulata]|nr:NAD-P-binding protein [Trametes cingulata]
MPSADRPTTWLVTGTSRGIGLELVKQLVASPANTVIATCRNVAKASSLTRLKDAAQGELHILELEVDDFDAIRASAKDIAAILGDRGLDYLVNNAGIVDKMDTAFTLDPESILRTTRTNVAAPALLSQVCLPFLEKSTRKTILNISSTGASMVESGFVGAGLATYCMSKSALNMLTYKQKVERPDLIVISMCPGWAKTDMGGPDAKVEVPESVAGILKVITSVTSADSGRFIRYNGEEIAR